MPRLKSAGSKMAAQQSKSRDGSAPSEAGTAKPAMVVMAVLGRAKGLRGEIAAKSHTADPLALAAYGPLSDAAGRRFDIMSIRPQGNGADGQVVLALKGVTDRTAAERLNGVELLLARDALPATGADDFYHADLIGLAALTGDGAKIGTVIAVHDFGAGDMLELRLAKGGGAYIPFSKAAVPEVDVAGGRVTVDPHAAGLIDDEDRDGEAIDARRESDG
jgi:16S rRNA processing protein RimM